MISPTLRTAFFFLSTAAISLAQVDDILANTGTFKPRITASDRYSEKVVAEVVDDFVYRNLEPNAQCIAATVVANLDGAATGLINGNTLVGVTVGHFDHSATLADAPDYRPGLKRATFALNKDVDMPNGDTREVRVGSVLYVWTTTTLTVTVTCTDVAGAWVGDVAASDYVAAADVGTTENIRNEPLSVSVNFGDATGTRTAYMRGATRTITRGFGSVAANTYEEFDLSDVTIQAASDVTGPVVKPIFPLKPNLLNKIDITGTADDITVVSIVSVTVNGIETPALKGSEDTGEDVWNWRVTGLLLKKGTSNVVITFSDEDGNLTKVTKSYVIK